MFRVTGLCGYASENLLKIRFGMDCVRSVRRVPCGHGSIMLNERDLLQVAVVEAEVQPQHRLRLAIEEPSLCDSPIRRVAVRTHNRTQFLRVQDVDWIEAAANYVRLHVRKETFLFRASMSAFEGRLDPRQFVRIHRSTIVNIDRIVELHPSFHREQIVVLADGTELRLSDSFKARLSALVHGL